MPKFIKWTKRVWMKLRRKPFELHTVDKTCNQSPWQKEWGRTVKPKGHLSTSDKKAERVWTQSLPTCLETQRPPLKLSAPRVHIQVSCPLSRKPMRMVDGSTTSWKSMSDPDVTRCSGNVLTLAPLPIESRAASRGTLVLEVSVVSSTPIERAQSEPCNLPAGTFHSRSFTPHSRRGPGLTDNMYGSIQYRCQKKTSLHRNIVQEVFWHTGGQSSWILNLWKC